MPKSEIFSWKTKEGDNIHGQKWQTPDLPNAIVILVHGLGEHIDRYEHVASFFNQRKISVYGFDHRGHGKSSGKRGHIASTQDYFADIDYVIELAMKENPDTPIFLYGHSLGGNMVLNYSLKKKPVISGVICTSPGLAVGDPVPPLKLFLAKVLKVLLPSMTMENGLDVNNLSRDPLVVKNYQEDPLVHSMISAKLAMDMIASGEWVTNHAAQISIPLLLMVGSEDHIINLEKVKEFAENVPKEFLTFKIFSDYYHELHNDYEKESVFNTIIEWLVSQTK